MTNPLELTGNPIAPTRQAAAIEGRSARIQVTGKLRAALDFMVWQGLKRDEAAEKAGMKDHSVRAALKKPHVLAYYNAELASLRMSKRARNVHRLDDIADGSRNDMARVAAIKALEQMSDESGGNAGSTASPGVVIQIINAPQQQPSAPIDVTPIVITP